MIEAKVNIKINQRATNTIMQQLANIINTSALAIHKDAVIAAPKDIGQLHTSLFPNLASATKLIAEIKPDENLNNKIKLNYAASVEFGSRPHFIPIEPLLGWVKRHGMKKGVAYAIRNKKSKTGTKKRPFLMPAYRKNLPWFIQNVARTLRGMDFNVNVSTRNM